MADKLDKVEFHSEPYDAGMADLEWGLTRNPFAHDTHNESAKAGQHLSRLQEDIGWLTVNGVPLADVLERLAHHTENGYWESHPDITCTQHIAALRALAGKEGE